MPYVYLDPTETLGVQMGVHLIVEAPTGVFYGTQCNGLACNQEWVEGYLVPIATPAFAHELFDWFEKEFRGWSRGASDWTEARVQALGAKVASLTLWYQASRNPLDDEIAEPLRLDESRLETCYEAWVPVVFEHGRGFLTWCNSD